MNSYEQALAQLTTHYNDHRTTTPRLHVYGAYVVKGEVVFGALILLANFALPMILLLLSLSAKGEKHRWTFFCY